MKRRHAFTLIELLTGMIVLIIIAGVSTLSFNIGRQTPQREAEKIASKIHRLTQQADRIHKDFKIKFTDINRDYDFFEIHETDKDKHLRETFKASSGIKLQTNVNDVTYNHASNSFDHNFKITVSNEDKTKQYYVIFYEGRVRTSDEPPENWEK